MKNIACFLLVLLAVTGGMFAQDSRAEKTARLFKMSLEELLNVKIVTASKSPVKLEDIPSAVTVITDDEIRRYGWRNLADVLKAQAGFDVFSDRIYNYIVPRGYSQGNDPNSRILLLINGHSVVEFFGYYNGHLPSVDLDNVERIEIVRGPYSALYGTNAMFAVINVITYRNSEEKTLQFVGESGSFGHRKYAVNVRRQLSPDVHFFVGGSLLKTGTQALYFDEYDDPAYPSDGFSKPTANTEWERKFYFNIGWKYLSLHGMHNKRKKNVPTGLYGGRFNDDGTYFRDTNQFLELKFAPPLGERSSGHMRLYLDRYRFDGRYLYYPDPAGIRGPSYESEYNEIKNAAIGGEILFSTHLNSKNHTTVGIEYKRYSWLEFTYISENDPEQQVNQCYDLDPKESIISAFALHRFIPSSRWVVEAGLHYDHYTSVGSHVSLRGSLSYKLFKRHWLKFLYGEAFRAPNSWELQGGFLVTGNGKLKPEVIRTGEMIYTAKLNDTCRLDAAFFYYSLRDNILARGGMAFENFDTVNGRGAELGVKFFYPNWQAYANLSYSRVTGGEDNGRIGFSAQWMVKAGMVTPLFKRTVALGVETQVVGPRLKGDPLQPRLKAYALTNISLTNISLSKTLSFSFGVYNLFDVKYQHPSFVGDLATWNMNRKFKVYDIPADGRSFILKVILSLGKTGGSKQP